MFQAILHVEPDSLTPEERKAVAESLRWYIHTYLRDVQTNFQPNDVDIIFVEALEGSLLSHVIVGTVSGLHRLWGTDHEAILEMIIDGVSEGSRPERYNARELLRLTQAARAEAVMPRGEHWQDDPRPPDPADGRSNLGRQDATMPAHVL